MSNTDSETLKMVHQGEQLGEAIAQLAGTVVRYYESLSPNMPEELKQHLTLNFAGILHRAAMENPMLRVMDALKGLDE